jgi:hypothetical protein
VTSERPPIHAPDWRTADHVVTLRDHEQRAVAMLDAISAKIRRLEQARAFRQAALQRIRSDLAAAIARPAGTSRRED